jgi:hypothetical protein
MADTYYAWAPVLLGYDESGKADVIAVGDTVTKAKVGDSFDQHVESGAFRTSKYPDVEDPNMSPVEHYKAQVAALQSELETNYLADVEAIDIDPTGGAVGTAEVAETKTGSK